MKKILGTLVLALLLGTPVLAQPVIVGDPTSVGFSTNVLDSDSVTRSYMWFNVVLSNTGSGSPSAIGGVSLAAQVGGPWAAAHLSAPPNYGTGGASSDNRFNGLQWASIIGAGNYAFGTAITTSCDYPTSTSGVFGTIGSGGYLTFGIDNQSSVVTPVSNGMILARLYFGWDGSPLGANSVTVSLLSESGNPAQGPSIFASSGVTSSGHQVIGAEVFSAASTFTITAPSGTFSVTAFTSTNWVYQNSPVTTADRHQISLTISATDTWGNTSYTATVNQTGPGVVTPALTWVSGTTVTPTGAAPVVWTVPASTTFSGYLIGGRISGAINSTANLSLTANCTVTVTVQGNVSGPANLATTPPVSFFVRPLGGIAGANSVTTTDKNALNSRLSGGLLGWDPNIWNLDGISGPTTTQKNILNTLLNGASLQ